MIVTLLRVDRIYRLTLPEKVSGRYWLRDQGPDGQERRLASIEGENGVWLLRSSRLAALLDDQGVEQPLCALEPLCFYTLKYRDNRETAQLVVEPITRDRQEYTKYWMKGNCRLSIGRQPDNQIVLNSPFVTGHHATLSRQEGAWAVEDHGSTNGVFVNGLRIRRGEPAPLHPGDAIYIIGVQVVIGSDFFAINHPDGAVALSGECVPFSQSTVCIGGEETEEEEPPSFFSPSPRFRRGLKPERLQVDGPPSPPRAEEIPLGLLLGPAMTMGMTSLVMAGVALYGLSQGTSTPVSVLPTLVMSFSMLCGTLLWPMLTKKSEKRRRKKAEEKRRETYRAYLNVVQEQLFMMAQAQQSVLLESSLPPQALYDQALHRQRGLWDHAVGQEDFLHLRLGLGNLPMAVELRFPERRFSPDDDFLLRELYRLEDAPKELTDVPVCLSLVKDTVCGVVGTSAAAGAFARMLTLQLAVQHSYDEVRLVFALSPGEEEAWSFARWLPHTWEAGNALRLFAAEPNEYKALSSHLQRVLMDRGGPDGPRGPHYVIFASSQEILASMDVSSSLLAQKGDKGVSVVVLVQELRDLPKECTKVVELLDSGAFLSDKDDRTGMRTAFAPDSIRGLDLMAVAKTMLNTPLDIRGGQQALPKMLTFLELLAAGRTEHLNALARWGENNPVHSLRAPVGVDVDGNPFYLDLHERFQGPHGLVAGMTGSGKSEFIITYILSMAINYHPDEVAFILIDYKGGGLAGAFEDAEHGIHLPHLAGTITNLDGAAVKRSLVSIQSELRRRQSIFNRARDISNEGTMDIYKYQRMYRAGVVDEPVPHLFIVSDEFAELKVQQPEFMDQLVSAARIGRSLGVHLILATQKPDGVVSEQIWSNSRFRVCLKVQEKADSMSMLKRPDAASLVETGRFYLQVGYDEFFALGQSAWCGAPYVTSNQVRKNRDESVAVMDRMGRILSEVRPAHAEREEGGVTQVVSVVRYLSNLARDEQVGTRPLWLPAMPEVLPLVHLAHKYSLVESEFELAPLVGEYDDPFNQRQGPLTVPFTREGNAILYGNVGSGKGMFLEAMLCSLLSRHDARHLNLYLLDLETEGLNNFRNAPQVGDVLLSADEEKLRGLLLMLRRELNTRTKLFAEVGGDLPGYCKATGEVLPNILVVIRNYSAFAEQFELYEEQLMPLAREGNKFGLYFLLTAGSPGAVRYRMMQNFKQLFVLRLNDRADYVGLLGSTDGVYPSALSGRGLVRLDKVYEFQSARYTEAPTLEALRAFCAGLGEGGGAVARPVPFLPDRVTPALLAPEAKSLDAVPVGVEQHSLLPARISLARRAVWPILGQDREAAAAVAAGLGEVLVGMEDITVSALDIAGVWDESSVCFYRCTGALETDVRELFWEMARRNNEYKTAKLEQRPPEIFQPRVVLLSAVKQLMDSLTPDGKEKLQLLLEKAEPAYRFHVLLCDTSKELEPLSSEAWFRRQVSNAEGLWAGDGFTEQNLLRPVKITNDLYTPLAEGFGFVVKKGRPVLAKLVSLEKKGEDEG